MRFLRPALYVFLAASCFDPLYELGPGRSWTVCCRNGFIDTCECLDDGQCASQLTACAANRCVVTGSCSGGTGGGAAGAGGHGGGMGSPGGGSGNSDAGVPLDAGVTMDAGSSGDGGVAPPPDAGSKTDGGTPPPPPPYEICCTDGRVGSCVCTTNGCGVTQFTPCAMGRCVALGLTCP